MMSKELFCRPIYQKICQLAHNISALHIVVLKALVLTNHQCPDQSDSRKSQVTRAGTTHQSGYLFSKRDKTSLPTDTSKNSSRNVLAYSIFINTSHLTCWITWKQSNCSVLSTATKNSSCYME